ncbi:hypothetical protein [Jatrophihabitans fulvus]
MASGVGRLGSVLNDLSNARGLGDVADTRSDVLDALQVLAREPSPRGREAATARRLHDWAAARWPHLTVRIEPVGEHGANLVASHGPGPLLYSHLDTSLDGSPRDAWVSGRDDAVGPLRVEGDDVSGFGLTVARAPAAAALVAFAGARSGSLLLASAGTHRRGSGPTGLEYHLATHGRPSSAVVAKSGPAGVLWEEPGAAYLTVRVTGTFGAALFPDSAVPVGGLVAHAGVVLDGIARWRANYLRTEEPLGQVGPACGVGAITGGWHDKPDLLPGALEVGVYLATVPGADVPALARDLRYALATACADGPLAGSRVDVDHEIVHAAAGTPADAPVVRAAVRAWTDEFGAPGRIADWAGTTDGVVLRGAGVPTVRLGPRGRAHPDDARRDVLSLDQLTGFVRVYRSLLDTGGTA